MEAIRSTKKYGKPIKEGEKVMGNTKSELLISSSGSRGKWTDLNKPAMTAMMRILDQRGETTISINTVDSVKELKNTKRKANQYKYLEYPTITICFPDGTTYNGTIQTLKKDLKKTL